MKLTGKDISGLVFGYLTVGDKETKEKYWPCRCECGSPSCKGAVQVSRKNLRSGQISCSSGDVASLYPSLCENWSYMFSYSTAPHGMIENLEYELWYKLTTSPCEDCGEFPKELRGAYSTILVNRISKINWNLAYWPDNIRVRCRKCHSINCQFDKPQPKSKRPKKHVKKKPEKKVTLKKGSASRNTSKIRQLHCTKCWGNVTVDLTKYDSGSILCETCK